MKSFDEPSPDLGSAAVRAFRTRDDAKTLAAVAAATGPFTGEVAAELVALAFAFRDNRAIAAKAKKVVARDIAGATALAAAFRGAGAHQFDDVIRRLDHPLRLAIGKAIVFHTWCGLAVPFEEDAAFRGAILDIAIACARREGEMIVELGEIYTDWHGHQGSAALTRMQVFPDALARELAARRRNHPFTGLAVSDGELTDLPASLARAKGWLTALRLDGNPLERVPDVIFQLANLEELSLSGTELADVPAELAKLRRLRRLDLDNMTRMRTIPDAVCALDQITHLRISAGSIARVPAAIAGMTSLEVLEMRAAPITTLPAEIATLPKLKKIEADFSRLNAAATRALLPKRIKLKL